MKETVKTVSFNDDLDIYMTYSSDEYCRHQIKSTKLKFEDRKISPQVWKYIFIQLDLYKLLSFSNFFMVFLDENEKDYFPERHLGMGGPPKDTNNTN